MLERVGPRVGRKIKMCGFCGIRPGTQRGHIVPRSLFHKQPQIHWTVPACDACERGSGDGIASPIDLDEAYLRDLFCMDARFENHPVIKALVAGKWSRSTGKSVKFWKAAAKTFEWRLPANEAGIVLPQAVPTDGIETHRFERVLRKIARGLYYLNNDNKSVPPTHEVGVTQIRHEGFCAIRDQFRGARNTGLQSLGDDGVFEYLGAWRPAPYATEQSFLMVFYRCHAALVNVFAM